MTMSWTKEDQAKLREYQTAQMTVKKIAKTMQKPQEWIRSELEAMGYTPIETKQPAESEFLKNFKPVEIKKKPYTKITPEIEEKCVELRGEGKSFSQIARKLNIGTSSVTRILKKYASETEETETKEDKPVKAAKINEEFDAAVNKMLAEAKEKEPAPSANDASSEEITPVIPIPNDITQELKSQAPALTGIKMMTEIEAMLGECFGRDAEIISVSADGEHCDIGFTYQDREYSLLFAQREEVPEYDRADRR